MKIFCIAFATLILTLTGMPAWAQTTSETPVPVNFATRISLPPTKMYPDDFVELIGQKYGLNILMDVYVNESAFEITLDKVTLRDAVYAVARLFNREVLEVGEVFVLRHVDWVVKYRQEEKFIKEGVIRWVNDGSVRVEALPIEPTSTSLAAVQLTAPSTARYNVNVRHMSVGSFIRALSNKTGWQITATNNLHHRRVTGSLTNVAPGQVTSALSTLLYSVQVVRLEQSDEQKADEDAVLKDKTDPRVPREKESALLRPELEKLLTPEEREAIGQGKEVAISLSRMPPELRRKATTYIKNQSANDPTKDLSRISEFALVFLPLSSAPRGALGINGFATDGLRFRY